MHLTVLFHCRDGSCGHGGPESQLNELRRQRSQRELRQQVARQKCREACPDPDPDGDCDVPDCDNPTDKPKLKESDITGLKYSLAWPAKRSYWHT